MRRRAQCRDSSEAVTTPATTASVFSARSGDALTQVPGSPFATGGGPASVAFSPNGGLLVTANNGARSGSVGSVGERAEAIARHGT